jgi:hypothetical protein
MRIEHVQSLPLHRTQLSFASALVNETARTGGDVGHLLGEAGLLDGGDGVTATNDGDGALYIKAGSDLSLESKTRQRDSNK